MIHNLGHGVSAVQQLRDAVLHDLPQHADLFGVGELLHIAQIDGLLVDGQAVKAGTADLCPIPQTLGGAQFPVKIRLRGLFGGLFGQREGRSFLFGKFRDVNGRILLHLNDAVRLVEIGSAASGHQDCGDAEAVVELPHPVDKGDDGLAVPVDNPLHQLVPDHEVGGAGVLVD